MTCAHGFLLLQDAPWILCGIPQSVVFRMDNKHISSRGDATSNFLGAFGMGGARPGKAIGVSSRSGHVDTCDQRDVWHAEYRSSFHRRISSGSGSIMSIMVPMRRPTYA